VTDEEVSLITM